MSIILWGKSTTTDKLIHIKNFNKLDEIVCLGCGSKLIAKQGKEKIWHFAHHNLANCDGGFETTLHLLAKEMFSNLEFFILPNKLVEFKYGDYYDFRPLIKNPENRKVFIEGCILEQRIENIKPDIFLIDKDGKKLLVEIAVTHFVDNKKRVKIEKLGISCIEINLSHLKNKYFDYQKLKEELKKPKKMYWIFHKNEKIIVDRLENKFKDFLQKEKEIEIKKNSLPSSVLIEIERLILTNDYDISIFDCCTRKGFLHLELGVFLENTKLHKDFRYLSLEIIVHPTSDKQGNTYYESYNFINFKEFKYTQLSELATQKILDSHQEEIHQAWKKAKECY